MSRKNYIESVRVGDAHLVREEEKAEAFFKHFDDILGSRCSREANLDFTFLGLPVIDTSLLDVCFSEEEVWRTIQEIPVDRAPGPDGFTGLFYRTAWNIIKPDIMRAFHALWALDGRSLYLKNQAYIVLLKKKEFPAEISDYRPISLIHSFAKLFTKVLATRLALLMQQLVRPNQSAFIRGRVIHENFRAVQLSAKLLRRNKRPSALMKIDIAKAFDTINWPYLFQLLEHLGFSRRWINWISLILSSASTKIILNGSPGRRICHARGLRQGDPLSPLLFVIAMEALNALIRTAENSSVLGPLDCKVKERAFFYADDMVFFVAPKQQDLVIAKVILEIFGQASGLRTNGNKCLISPIHCDLEDTVTLLRFFPGKLAPFPVRYLGIPLAISRLKKADLQPLVDKVANCLPTWKGSLINKAGRAVLIKAKLSAIPVHTALAIEISPWVIKCIDKLRRSFLWSGNSTTKGGCCSVAWPKVSPARARGLGIIDLKLFGYALRMRWLWFQKTDTSRPWSHLPVKHEHIVTAMFEASISVQVGDGTRALFWRDRWLQGRSIADLAPCLFDAVGQHARRCRTVAAGCSQRAWVQDITGALTVQVILDYLSVWDLVESTSLQPNTPDRFLWKWTADHVFTTASAYRAFFVGQYSIAGAKTLCKTRAPGKCKFFGWLAIHDRCWTAERRKRHNLQQDDTCVLCC